MGKLSFDDWQMIAVRYESGEKPGKICADYGISIGLMNWNMLKIGANPPGAKLLPARAPGPDVVRRGKFVVRHFSDDEDRQLLDLARQGLNPSAIGRALGRKPNSVRGRLMTLARHEARKEEAV